MIEWLGQTLSPVATNDEVWGPPSAPVPLRFAWYLGLPALPAELITSVRAIVRQHDQILVIHDPDGCPHIIPGGRCEAGETPEATVRREVLEETGWALGPLQELGFVHLHNLGPNRPGNPYPYPDAFQVIYFAVAQAYHPEALVVDEWVVSSAWQPLATVQQLPLRAGELALLHAALTRYPD